MSLSMTGLRAWFVQRVTAVYLGLFVLYLLVHFALAPPNSFEEWHDWMRQPGVLVSWALLFVALLMHAWIGARDVVLDYVYSTPVRLVVLVMLAVFLVAQGFWALHVLFGVGP